jgi:hypothetical protein
MRVRASRNLSRFPDPASVTKEDYVALERDIGKVFDLLIVDPAFGGRYVSITPFHSKSITDRESRYRSLAGAGIIFGDLSAYSYFSSASPLPPFPSLAPTLLY